MLPILSYFFLKKRCRYCKVKISWYYPLVEAVTGALFSVVVFLVVGLEIIQFLQQYDSLMYIIFLLFVISILIVIFFIDLKYGIIPFKIVLFGLGGVTFRYLYLSLNDSFYIVNYLLTGVVVFLIFCALFMFTRGRAIGFGDVFYSILMGYLLGYPKVIVGVYISFLTGAFISLILVLANKKKLRGGKIPFGPFLALGTLAGLFWGDFLIDWALSYLYVN
jgi:leader peptidase (prepilin peptidase)/N-methyltransferase